MAEKISVQIALEGGKEVARQLEDIGAAGQQAFEDIAKSAEQVGGFKNLNPEEVTGKLKQLGIEGTAAFDKIQQAVKSAARFETLVQGVQSVETALVAMGRAAGPVGLAIAAAFQSAAKATIAFAETINKVSDQAVKAGMSFDQFTKLRKTLEQFGLFGDTAARSIEAFQKALGERVSFTGLGEASNLVKNIGESADRTAERTAKLRDELARMPDTSARLDLAKQAFDNNEQAAIDFVQSIRRANGEMSDAEAKAYDLQQALKQLDQAWTEFGSVSLAPTLTAGINVATAAIKALNAALQENPWGVFLQAASLALNPIAGLVQQATKAIAELIAEVTGISWEAIASGATAAWNAVTTAVQSAGSAISDFVSKLATITWDAISSAGVAAWDAITTAIQNAINKVMEFIGLRPSAPVGGGAGAGGMAGGGIIGGRGSGTSDSNLAWVSRGEYITPARAVAQPGVLAFLEALRRSGGNLRGVLDGMGRFALGGLVPRPAYAAGGPVGSMSNVTINFPGLQPISGLRASEAVVDELRKAAALAQVRSGGRKPSRYS